MLQFISGSADVKMLSMKHHLFLQVLLGRATEDVIVDIDLGREGRANKISRRQVGFSGHLVHSYY